MKMRDSGSTWDTGHDRVDATCPMCGDPNGTPCTSCGYKMREPRRARAAASPSREMSATEVAAFDEMFGVTDTTDNSATDRAEA